MTIASVREKAVASLVEIGSPALAKVTAATKDASAERSQRATSILALRSGRTRDTLATSSGSLQSRA